MLWSRCRCVFFSSFFISYIAVFDLHSLYSWTHIGFISFPDGNTRITVFLRNSHFRTVFKLCVISGLADLRWQKKNKPQIIPQIKPNRSQERKPRRFKIPEVSAREITVKRGLHGSSFQSVYLQITLPSTARPQQVMSHTFKNSWEETNRNSQWC